MKEPDCGRMTGPVALWQARHQRYQSRTIARRHTEGCAARPATSTRQWRARADASARQLPGHWVASCGHRAQRAGKHVAEAVNAGGVGFGKADDKATTRRRDAIARQG